MEDVTETETPESIRYDDSIRFLKALTGSSDCYACGAQSWEVATAPNDDLVQIASPMKKAGKHVNFIVLTCNRCGLERKHRTSVIREWLAENPAPSSPEAADA